MNTLLFLTGQVALGRQGAKGRFPVMGWNTWCTQDTCGVDWCSSKEVLNVAETIKSSGLQSIGYDHILLDDCWGQRDNLTQEIIGDPHRFPEGMKAFTSKIHALGFKFGIYTDIGTAGCHHPFTGSFGHYRDDAATFKEWGIDYVKFDGCDLPHGYTAEELTCNMSQALLDTGEDFWFNFHCWHTDTCAKCGTSFRVDHDHHDEWSNTASIISFLQNRQSFWGPDPAQGWPDPDFIYTGGQGCSNVDPGPDAGAGKGPSPPGVRCPGQTEDEYISEFTIWSLAGGQLVFATDPRNMTAFQRKVWFNTELIEVFNDTTSFKDVAVISKKPRSPILITESTKDTEEFACSLVKQLSHARCIKGSGFGCDAASKTMWIDKGCRGVFKCGTADYVVANVMQDGNHTGIKCVNSPKPPPDDDDPQVWARPTSDGGAAIALHNPANAPTNITVIFADIPERTWDSATMLKVRDMWTHTNNGTAAGSFSAVVAVHGTVAIKLMP